MVIVNEYIWPKEAYFLSSKNRRVNKVSSCVDEAVITRGKKNELLPRFQLVKQIWGVQI